jgi:hypothetical protein
MFTDKEFANQSNNAFYACCYKNDWNKESELLRTVFNRGFYIGAQYAIHTSSELSPHIARFLEFTMWLTERKITLEDDILPPY